MLPVALHWLGLCVVFCITASLATPLPFYSPPEGSTDEEEHGYINSSASTRVLPTEYQTTPAEPVQEETDFLNQLVSFLEENMLLILVATTLLLLVFLIICGTVVMSRRRKVNAYYPSSFPSKMYVDHQDKTGGAKPFNEVQGKTAAEEQREPVDSNKQLQADIMRVVKSLRTPNKSADDAEGGESCQDEAERSPENSSKADGNILDQKLQSVPEEKPSEISYIEAAAACSAVLEDPLLNTGDEGEPLTGKSLRPSSLHIHNESATLQLIAGEKTAF